MTVAITRRKRTSFEMRVERWNANLVALTLLTFFTLLLPVAARSSFVQTSTQRVEIVGELSRAIEILFRRRAIRATRTLLRRLQPLRNVVEASFNRALVVTTSALLSLLTLLFTAVQRLLSFTNAIGDTVTRQRIRRIFVCPHVWHCAIACCPALLKRRVCSC